MTRVLRVVAMVLLLSVTGLTAASAQGASHWEIVGSFGGTNPCNGETMGGPLEARGVYHERGGRVTLTVRFAGDLTGNQGNTYIVRGNGSAQFDTVSGTYSLPLHSQFISKGGAPNIAVDLSASVTVLNGQVVGVFAVATDFTCHG